MNKSAKNKYTSQSKILLSYIFRILIFLLAIWLLNTLLLKIMDGADWVRIIGYLLGYYIAKELGGNFDVYVLKMIKENQLAQNDK